MTKDYYRTLWLMHHNAIHDIYRIIEGTSTEDGDIGKDLRKPNEKAVQPPNIDLDIEVTKDTTNKLSMVLDRLRELGQETSTAKEVSEQPA